MQVRGTNIDAAINIYEQYASGTNPGTLRHGILFGEQGSTKATFASGTDPASGGTGSAVLAAKYTENVKSH